MPITFKVEVACPSLLRCKGAIPIGVSGAYLFQGGVGMPMSFEVEAAIPISLEVGGDGWPLPFRSRWMWHAVDVTVH